MAIVLELKYDATTLSFQDGTSGLQLDQRGWFPAATDAESVNEQLSLFVQGTSTDAIATKLQTLSLFAEYVDAYRTNPSIDTPVWLHCKMDSETNERRALVKRITFAFGSSWFDGGVSEEDIMRIDMTIKRGPWEATTATTHATATGLSATGGQYDPTSGADETGDMRSRTSYLSLPSSNLSRFWMGVRSEEKHGDLTKFYPLWEFEDAITPLESTAALLADSTASPGGAGDTALRITDTSTDDILRATLELNNVVSATADIPYNFGSFLWLLRARANSSSSWDVHVRFGYRKMSDDACVRMQKFTVDSSTWDYYIAAHYPMPQRDIRLFAGSTTDDGYVQIRLFAKNTAGVGTLDLDCFVLIPTDEGYAIVDGSENSSISTTFVFTGPDGAGGAIMSTSAGYANPKANVVDFGLRPGKNNIIIAGARASHTDITDSVNATLYTYPRFKSLRGAG